MSCVQFMPSHLHRVAERFETADGVARVDWLCGHHEINTFAIQLLLLGGQLQCRTVEVFRIQGEIVLLPAWRIAIWTFFFTGLGGNHATLPDMRLRTSDGMTRVRGS